MVKFSVYLNRIVFAWPSGKQCKILLFTCCEQYLTFLQEEIKFYKVRPRPEGYWVDGGGKIEDFGLVSIITK